jgi:tetratricopeptide (TPR) repeat protein
MNQTDYYQQIPHNYYVGGGKKVAFAGAARHYFATLFYVVLIALTLASSSLASTVWPPGAATGEGRIAGLIDQLRSDDAGRRQAAANALVDLGAPARPAVLKLLKAPDPGLRSQAAQILLKLPWYLPEDPPTARELLIRYGTPDVDVRRELVRDLAQLDRGQGLGALARLLDDDPSPAVQWTIVSWLRQVGNLDGLRNVQAPADNSRLLALCGYARLLSDPPAAAEYLRQCAELEFADPADDGGEFDMVVHLLADYDCDHHQYDQAAQLRRRELARGSPSDQAGVQVALIELFALQADFGPINGIDNDFRLAGNDILKPKLQYALARLNTRLKNTAKARAAEAAAFAGSTNRIQRYDVADFLCEHEWNKYAESELTAYLKMDRQDGGIDSQQEDANVYLRLAGLAVQRGDDFSAAQDKEQAMILLGNHADLGREDAAGHRWPVPPGEIWAEIYWRYFRAANAQNNEKEVNRRLEQLMELKPTNSEIAIDVVPVLRKKGRDVDANLLFQWAYDEMKKQLDAAPDDPDKLNGVAWLCAKCQRRLPEALADAQKAAALVPNNAAIMDTEAEVNFQLGHPEEALRLETQAARLQPDDDFMKQQLARFKATIKPH